MAQVSPTNLLNYDNQGLIEFFESIGEKSYRATQVMKWMHDYGITDFEQMTNLSQALRQRLQNIACIQAPEITQQQVSDDGTIKWLMKLSDGNAIETVYIPEAGRGTLCVSSQVGCALNCSFCATARTGFNRNLSVAEIIGQVWLAVRSLSQQEGRHDRHVTNVVMMGMGEPLLNFDPVVKAMDIMMDDHAYGLSKYRVTLSTSGVVPAMYDLAEISEAALAVSLHAPIDELRNELVPINKKYPLNELMDACKQFFDKGSKRKITFEYVMLNGVNDSEKHAKQLVKLLEGVPAKMNLIPFNPFPNARYECSSDDRIYKFQSILLAAGVHTATRKTRGDDIDAACGQLVGEFKDRTKRSVTMRNRDIVWLQQEGTQQWAS